MSATAAPATAIRPFRVETPEPDLVDLRRRIAATRWPERETVDDRSQGAQLAKLRELVRYWSTGYDWRKAEARLNACPQCGIGVLPGPSWPPRKTKPLESGLCLSMRRVFGWTE